MSCSGIIRRVDGVTIVDLSGRITVDGAGVLRDTVKRLVENGEKAIVLNLARVNSIDSIGLGELVSGYVTLASQGGCLKLLLNAQKHLHAILEITQLNSVMEAFTDEADAVASFPKAAKAASGW